MARNVREAILDRLVSRGCMHLLRALGCSMPILDDTAEAEPAQSYEAATNPATPSSAHDADVLPDPADTPVVSLSFRTQERCARSLQRLMSCFPCRFTTRSCSHSKGTILQQRPLCLPSVLFVRKCPERNTGTPAERSLRCRRLCQAKRCRNCAGPGRRAVARMEPHLAFP